MKLNKNFGTLPSYLFPKGSNSRNVCDTKTTGAHFLVILAGTLFLSLTTSTVWAGDFQCTHNLGAVTISDNVNVPPNGECKLTGTIVEGNVEVGQGGTLTLAGGATIDGNLIADGAANITVKGSTISGNLEVKNSGDVDVRNATVDGNLIAEGNTGDLVFIGNDIDGNIEAFNNDQPPIAQDNNANGNLVGQAASAELPCPCAIDLPSGWRSFAATSIAANTICPDGSTITSSASFNNFVGLIGEPFFDVSLTGNLSQICGGTVVAECKVNPDGDMRTIRSLQYNFCRSIFSAP